MTPIAFALTPDGLAARLLAADASAEHAFLLYHEGRHVARVDAGQRADVRFTLSPLPGEYEVAVLRRDAPGAAWRRAGGAALTVGSPGASPAPATRRTAGRAPAPRPARPRPSHPPAPAAPPAVAPGAAVLLHIGLPKTGTTYLQRTFHAAWAGQACPPVDYPEAGFYNHQVALYEPLARFLPWTARRGHPDRWRELQAAMQRDTGGVATLLSAEALSALSDEGVASFRDLLGGRPVGRIIITVRPLASLLPSHWQQNMKQGGRGDLGGYAARMLELIERGEHPAPMFSYRHTVQAWRRVFPHACITVLAMDGSHTQNLLSFARLCGLGSEHDARLLASVPTAAEQNLSFSVQECSQLLEINEQIARGELPVSARRLAMDRFFQAREAGGQYERPTLSPAHREQADALDQVAREWLRVQPECELVHGRNEPVVTPEAAAA
ncbi:hypothetical protein [Ideonella sp.]|uniref:hypothetical protein n=1 Tax=Ideonella sp. TaxID=1929293 RepID=UPI0035B24A6B